VNRTSWSRRLICAVGLVAAFSLAGQAFAQVGKGTGPPKGKNTIQIDLDKLPPNLARQVLDATRGDAKKGAAAAPSKGKKPEAAPAKHAKSKGAAAAPSKGKKAGAAAPSKGKKAGAAAPSKGKKAGAAAPSKGKSKKSAAAAPSKGKKPAAGPGKHGKGAPGKHGKGLALGHQIAPGLKIAPGLHKKGAAAPGKHGKGPGMHQKGPAKHGKGSTAAPSKGKKPERAPAPYDSRSGDLERRLDRILLEIEDIRREIRRR
jgi:hypothetical protein